MKRTFLFPALFAGILILISLVILPRLWDIRALFFEADIRASVQSELRRVANEQGWLLSDIAVFKIHERSLTILHRAHIRGHDPEHCFVIRTHSSVLHPCPAS